MKFETLLLVCSVCVIEGRTSGTWNSEENEVLDKGGVMVRFPSYLYEVPKETLQKNMVQKRFRGRNIPTSVVPMEESCYSNTFKMKLKEIKKQVKCMPRDTVVDIMTPTGITIIPNTVIVKRCGGACTGRYRCIATETRNTTFYVKTKMGSTVSCSSITVPEDIYCKCGCERKRDCPGEQTYDEDLCKCTCPQKRYRCEGDFKWDSQKCSCVCNRLCTTGTTLDHNKCRCVKKEK